MTRKSPREIERKLEAFEGGDGPPDMDALWIRGLKRAHGLVENPMPEEEFHRLWEERCRIEMTARRRRGDL